MTIGQGIAGVIALYLLCIALGAGGVILFSDDKWDRSTAVGVCGGMAILRRENGTLWLRVSGTRVYQIKDADKLTCR